MVVHFRSIFIFVFLVIMFVLFCIVDICKLLCVCVKGVILNEDLMMMMTPPPPPPPAFHSKLSYDEYSSYTVGGKARRLVISLICRGLRK